MSLPPCRVKQGHISGILAKIELDKCFMGKKLHKHWKKYAEVSLKLDYEFHKFVTFNYLRGITLGPYQE